MGRDDYRRGWEDAIEMVLDALRRKNLLTTEIEDVILRILAAVKEDKLQQLRLELGLP